MYMTQETIITQKTSKTNCDDSLASNKGSLSQNMNETEDSNENRNAICNMMKQHPIC
jgi:hypothetical protein